MPFARTSAGALYHEEQGEGEPLLLVPGLSNDHNGFILQVPAFSAAGLRTITFDNRDSGQSFGGSEPYEIRDMALDVIALADALELDSFHLLGVSMGGAIAQEVALAAPGRLKTLTLAVTWAGSGPWGELNARIIGSLVADMPREERIDYLMLLSLSEKFFRNPDAVAFVKKVALDNPFPQSSEAFARQVAASGRHETADRLGTLAMPVHVIGAEWDIFVPVWKSRELAASIPGATLTVLPEAPHGANIERADEFNRAVLEFLRLHRGAVN